MAAFLIEKEGNTMTLKLWSHNLSTLTHLSYNKGGSASHRLKFACSHNSHPVPQRKTEKNPLKKSLLIHKCLCWNVSHYCVLCLCASAALKKGQQESTKEISAYHNMLTTRIKCLKNQCVMKSTLYGRWTADAKGLLLRSTTWLMKMWETGLFYCDNTHLQLTMIKKICEYKTLSYTKIQNDKLLV